MTMTVILDGILFQLNVRVLVDCLNLNDDNLINQILNYMSTSKHPHVFQFIPKMNWQHENRYQTPKCNNLTKKGTQIAYSTFLKRVMQCTNRQLLVKHLVSLLKGKAFDGYTSLQPEFVDNLEELERKFRKRFCGTRVMLWLIVEGLAGRLLDQQVTCTTYNYKGRLSKVPFVEMFIQVMLWGLFYILQGIQTLYLWRVGYLGSWHGANIASHDNLNLS